MVRANSGLPELLDGPVEANPFQHLTGQRRRKVKLLADRFVGEPRLGEAPPHQEIGEDVSFQPR